MDAPLVLIIVGAAVAGFVQGLSGFGFSLVALSFWAWALDPKIAATLAVFGGLCGQTLAALRVRRGIDWPRLAPFVLGGLAGLPVGMVLLPHVDTVLFRAFVGTLLAVWCPLMLFSSRLPAITRGGRVGDALAGACGGAMGPLGGFTGAIPTLWCTLRGFERDTQRAVIQNFNLALLAVSMATHVASGLVTPQVLPLMAVVAPSIVVPALLGMKVYLGISPIAFRNVVLSLLTASGIAMLSYALPRLLAR